MGSDQKTANICVIGCGHWGKNLVRNFHALGSLHSICEGNPSLLNRFREEYQVKGFSELSEVLRDPEIDGIVVATPAEQHARMAIAGLEAGKDVFVEKPLALRWQDGFEMTVAARRFNRILMVGHLLIYHPAVVKIKELVDAGELGRLEYIYSNRLAMGKIRREENALWSFAPHDISVILRLTGSLPVQVSAVGGTYVQPNIADVTISNLLFDHGTRAHIFVSWLHPYKEQRLVVIGSKKMIVFEDSRATDKLVLYDKDIAWANGGFEVKQPKGEPVPFAPLEPLQVECQHFIDCIVHRQTPKTPGEDGVTVLQVLQACQRSLQMGGDRVQVTDAAAQRVEAM
ncbi:MAG TPA: Gfo/Idh/MocA family oxidoreductase [Bryobacteraceae bacterium]|nr:Gfo/Idh/MocA family oxidoreductase [Bryobacteraceae bacterium]